MKPLFEILNKKSYLRACGLALTSGIIVSTIPYAFAANVVQRPSAVTTASRANPSVARPTAAASRIPTMTIRAENAVATATTPVETTTTETVTVSEPEPDTTFNVQNKSSQFSTSLSSSVDSDIDVSVTNLAELIRAQRAALDAASASAVSASATNVSGSGENSCDAALRECMISTCGNNFGKCASDTDTAFGYKLDTCRRSTKCTGREYQLFAPEILADRNLNIQLSMYNSIIDCGTKYDACIVEACGATFSKCISKSAGDAAIAKCQSIADACIEQDSGLAMRAMGVFGEFRQDAERQISADEKRLYALREQMRNLCTRLGAMFDERSLDCVYTINFYADGDSTLYASKKGYAGGTFDCTQNWFGIDITTYRENAYRETRAQTAASSAMLGSGLGVAVGSITSGAIDRAIKRFKADTAVEKADCSDQEGKVWSSFWHKCVDAKDINEDELESGSGGGGAAGDGVEKTNK